MELIECERELIRSGERRVLPIRRSPRNRV